MESREKVTEFIRGYLRDQVSYTRTPGMIPLHKEPVEFFLFEKKEGYCQHFASAAVLMYRLYGIPARYAAGYRILRSDFEHQEDGCWHAAVTDASAHAWPEIFVEDYGWIPVEVTVDLENHTVSAGEGNKTQDQRQAWPTASFIPSDDSEGRTEPEERPEPQSEIPFTGQNIRFSKEAATGFLQCMAALVVSAVFLMFVWHYRVKWTWMRKGGSTRIYSQLLRMIHFAGYLKEYDGSEKSFPAKLAETFPAISYEEAERITGIVYEEVFGRPAPADPEKIGFAEEIYRRIAKHAFPKRAFYKRVWF